MIRIRGCHKNILQSLTAGRACTAVSTTTSTLSATCWVVRKKCWYEVCSKNMLGGGDMLSLTYLVYIWLITLSICCRNSVCRCILKTLTPYNNSEGSAWVFDSCLRQLANEHEVHWRAVKCMRSQLICIHGNVGTMLSTESVTNCSIGATAAPAAT